jgi:hypothetical protein
MKNFLLLFLLINLSTCASFNKLFNIRGDLPQVTLFNNEPPFEYEVLCKIRVVRIFRTYNDKIIVKDRDIKKEVRKCGGNGFIFEKAYKLKTGVTITGKGIKVYDVIPKINQENAKKLAFAAKNGDLGGANKILRLVSRRTKTRASKDSSILNGALYLAARKGLKCNKELVELLQNDYQAMIPSFNYVTVFKDQLIDQNIINCGNVLERSYSKIEKRLQFAMDFHDYFWKFLHDFPQINFKHYRLRKYRKILRLVTESIDFACRSSKRSKLCLSRYPFIRRLKAVSRYRKLYATYPFYYNEFRDMELSILRITPRKVKKKRKNK